MVNKVIKLVLVAVVCTAIIVLISDCGKQPPPPNRKIVMEMNMIPVDDSPGEYILEYSNGNRELLKKDGTIQPLTKKKQ